MVREANGQPISVFVSLKDGKLYVRQGWRSLFDAPVSFEHPEQPIGTHGDETDDGEEQQLADDGEGEKDRAEQVDAGGGEVVGAEFGGHAG